MGDLKKYILLTVAFMLLSLLLVVGIWAMISGVSLPFLSVIIN